MKLALWLAKQNKAEFKTSDTKLTLNILIPAARAMLAKCSVPSTSEMLMHAF